VWEGMVARWEGNAAWNPLLDERLPRLIVLLCSGASLAVAGAAMQALFHNPLASPNVLGISLGGSLLVLIVFITDAHLAYPALIPASAFFGSFLCLLLVYTIAKSAGEVQLHHLLLTGIALSTVFLAIEGTLLYLLRDQSQLIQLVTEWEAGSSAHRTWQHVHMQLPLTLVGLWGCWYYRSTLNLLSLGDEEALNLGVDVKKVRWLLFLSVALLTGGTLAALGGVPFFGLIIPHLIRQVKGPDNTLLLPLAAICGALTLSSIDLTLRLTGMTALSIGNLSALFGGLFFLYLLIKPQRQWVKT